MKWLKQALKASRENNTLYEKRIASKRQENAELKREIQRLNNKLLKKDAVDMTKDAAVEVSSRPLMVSLWPDIQSLCRSMFEWRWSEKPISSGLHY